MTHWKPTITATTISSITDSCRSVCPNDTLETYYYGHDDLEYYRQLPFSLSE